MAQALAAERQADPSPSATRSSGSPGSRAASQLSRPLPRVSCFGAGAIVNAGRCPHPYARPAHLDTAFAAGDGRTYQCLQPADATTPQLCSFGDTEHPVRTVAVVGNSHARRLVPALDLYGRQHRWRIVLAARINCLGLTTQPVGTQDAADSCLAWSAQAQRALLALPSLDAVIFASHITAQDYLAGPHASAAAVQAADQQIVATWSRFAHRGVRVIVTEDVPGMRPQADPDCIAQSATSYDPCAVDRSRVVQPNIMTTLAQQHPELVAYLPLSQYFCDATMCHGLIGGVVVYLDSHHMTDTYSESLAPYLGAQVSRLQPRTR